MLADTLEVDEDDEIEEEADAEVDKVLFDLTNGKLGQAGSVGTGLPVSLKTMDGYSHLTACPVITRPTGGGGGRERDGEIPRTAEWFTQRIGSTAIRS